MAVKKSFDQRVIDPLNWNFWTEVGGNYLITDHTLNTSKDALPPVD